MLNGSVILTDQINSWPVKQQLWPVFDRWPAVISSLGLLLIVSKEDAEDKRIGNTDRCGCYKSMDTYKQSLCYAETNEIPEEYFECM